MRRLPILAAVPLAAVLMITPAAAHPSRNEHNGHLNSHSGHQSAHWGTALDGAKITKTDLNAPDYQYPLIANGGLSLMPGPTGFPDVQPPNAPYAPELSYDEWWNNDTARIVPFTLGAGYQVNGAIQPATIGAFTQTLDVATGTLSSQLHLQPPPPPAPTLSLSDSHWVWYPAGAAGGADMPGGDAYFRTTLDIPAGATVVGAGAEVTADDSYTLYVNGTSVSTGAHWPTAQKSNIFNQVHPGTNTIAIRATNGTGPAGLIADIRVELADGTTVTLTTDGSWRSALAAPSGWQDPVFDDSSWVPVLDEAPYGQGPWATNFTNPVLVPPVAVPGLPGAFTSERTEFVTPDGVLVVRISDSVTHRLAVRIGAGSGFGVSYTAGDSSLVAVSSASNSDPMSLATAAQGTDLDVDAAAGTVTATVGPTHPVTFYVSAAGLGDTDVAAAAASAVSHAVHRGYWIARSAGQGFWHRYWGASSISVPDPRVMTWYIRGQYYIGALMANAHMPPGVDGPRGGPSQYGGDHDLEYDGVYDAEALLTANQPAVAGVTADWVERTLPAAQALAPKYGGVTPGAAKYPWLADYNGTEDSQFGPSPIDNDWEAYPSANAALIDLLQARYTNDAKRLERAKEILLAVTKYQLDNSAQDPAHDNEWVSQKFRWYYGPADGFVKGAVPDQAALLWSLREAASLGVGPAEWRDYAKHVYLPTGQDTARGESAITGYIGDTPSIANSMFVHLLPLYFFGVISPDDPLTEPTVANEVGAPDLYDSLIRGNAAVGAAIAGHGDESLALVNYMLDSTNAANPDTAILWDDTYFAEGEHCGFCLSGSGGTPNLSGHSTLDQAVQRMLMDGSSSSRITIFPSLPGAWDGTGTGFDTMLANGGIEVSAHTGKDSTTVKLTNASRQAVTRTMSVRVPANAEGVRVHGASSGRVHLRGQFAEFSETIPAGATRTVTVAAGKSGTWSTVDDTSSSLTYSSAPSWLTTTTATDWVDETAHYTDAAGATVETTVSGSAVQIIGDRGPNHGQFQVYVDGRLQGDYDAWQADVSAQQVLFSRYRLAPGPHTVKLKVLGIKDTQSSGAYIGLDAIQVLN